MFLTMSSPLARLRRSVLRVLACTAVAALMCAPMTAIAAPAGAPMAPDRPPILILDGGLGDVRSYIPNWLGVSTDVATRGSLRLITASAPVWWSGSGAPDTYILTTSDVSGGASTAPIGVTEIAWAIDTLAARHPVGKVVLVAQGAVGLQARAYLEDLGDPHQSARADVVGLVMLGSPNAGLVLPTTYPKLDVWAPYAQAAGLSPSDLVPGSGWLSELDSGRLPSVVKSMVVQGVVVPLGGADSDGVALRGDSVIATGVISGAIDYVPVKARASETWDLGRTWLPTTKRGGATLNVVDGGAVDRLGMARGYSTAPEVRDAVRTFYETWFADRAPITHISTRLVFDVSGSMNEKWGATTKLAAGRRAVADFAAAMAARRTLPGAVPEDIGLVVFNTKAQVAVSASADSASVTRFLNKRRAGGNTDVGKALARGVDSFSDAPNAADKYMVLLSDGLNTAGLDEKGIIAGPVAKAAAARIKIDTIALGTVGTSDVGFLKKVASSTGGTFHQARDLFELRCSFVKARYSSVGTLAVDANVFVDSPDETALGVLSEGAKLIEIAIVPDGPTATWSVLRDGSAVPSDTVKTAASPDGVTLIAVSSPKAGTYTLKVAQANGAKRAHVFAVLQADAFKPKGTAVVPDSNADLLIMIVVGGGVLAIIVALVTSIGSRRRRARESLPDDEPVPPEGPDTAPEVPQGGD